MSSTMQDSSWRDSVAFGRVLLLLYAGLAMLPPVLMYIVGSPSEDPLFVQIGKGAALLGFSLLVLQSVLSARLHWIDRPFGLDRVMRFHKGMAILAGVLILLHPVMLSLGYGGWSLFAPDSSWPINLGKAGLVLLVLAILVALGFRLLRIDYNVWRVGHKGVVILVVVLGFLHSMIVGSDLRNGGMRVYWIALFVVAVLLFVFRNAYVPLFGRRRYRVAAVERETHDTWTLAFEPEGGRAPMTHRPGQFWFLKLVRPGRRTEQHPFTISSSPTGEPPLTSTIKESGNFTRTIGETRVGDRARVEGPFGRFSLVSIPAESFLFIAGGVGITPIMSMVRYLRDTNDTRPVGLIYGNKTEKDVLFRQELEAMPDHVKVTHILSDPDEAWDGEKGFITTEAIRRAAGSLLETAHVYLCGPPVMMDKVIKSLRELGIGSARIHYERFTI